MTGAAAFAWRPIEPQDVTAWSRMLADIQAEDHDWGYFTEALLLDDFSDPDRDFARGSVGVHDGDAMVGYCVLVARTSADPVHEMYYDGGVHPGYRQRGIGTALLDWAEVAALPIHDERFRGRELSLSGSCLASNSEAVALFGAHGYQAARWFHAMERSLAAEIPAASDLAGVSIVGFTLDRSDDTRLIRNEAFRDHWGSREMTAEGWAHFLALSVFRPEFSYLAYADDEPLAMILCHEYDAFDDAIGQRDLNVAVVGTRIAGRNRGVATSLLVRALTDAKAAGYTTASLVVDADSLTGAVGLYERVGFAIQHTTITQTQSLAD